MTKRQIEMLRELIQAEIEYANGDWGNDMDRIFYSDTTEKWEKFAETFNSSTGPFEINV